jgi:putative hydrolases of HD superfamily
MHTERFRGQMDFLKEIEKLKIIYRQNGVVDRSRPENSAEHSWHIALMAIILEEYVVLKNIDILRVIKMLLIHDIVEIDAGDTFLYDTEGNIGKSQKEEQAARRIFGLLPEKQRIEFLELWREFESGTTPDAIYASCLDGLQPLVNRLMTGGYVFRGEELKTSQVLEKKKFMEKASPFLWDYAKDVIKESKDKGLYT